MSFDLITTEVEFMDLGNWGETYNGNPICTVEVGGHEFRVVLFQYRTRDRFGFVIYEGDGDGTFSKNDYGSMEEAQKWAWTRLDLLT